ncbi:c-type cytochrome [Derxia lacustris]|uniref:c-type cytochrome n=1 Tax=Derxia lacustris TaxID=764842 RepID=UPI001F39D914|nr:c-type cytochrome [Derxia lacustris]
MIALVRRLQRTRHWRQAARPARRLLHVGLLCSAVLALPALAQTASKPAAGKARATATPAGSAPAPFRGNAAAGRSLAESERCIECHGLEGQASAQADAIEGKFPRLAGQSPDYLLKQLRDLRSGARKNDFMQVMARSIDDATAADIVAYFSSLPPMRGEAGNASPAGRELYARGDAARGIPACASCHGANGEGQRLADGIAPRLGGQTWRYLERQLLDWRDGHRGNSVGGVMTAAVRGLSDAEITAIATHLSGLGTESSAVAGQPSTLSAQP